MPISQARETDNMTHQQEMIIFDFNSRIELEPWRVINDGVMGGLSESNITHSSSGTAVFKGNVSLKNNGGFASTRTLARPYEMGGQDGVLLKVKGDGKIYQFRVKTNERFDGVSYRFEFKTEAGSWTIIDAPFNRFTPVFRGRILDDVEPIHPENIRQLGFVISNRQADKFQLEIDWIKSYRK